MYSKEHLKNVILDQKSVYKLPVGYVRRELESEILQAKHSEIFVITGLRRVGKSTLLASLRQQFGGDYFVNFDDERLADFTVKDFQTLFEVLLEIYGKQEVLYFDEIQNISGWERFIRRMYDSGFKIFITGSNANLLSSDLGTHLTGRYVSYELFPFSFSEYLKARNISVDVTLLSTDAKVKLIRAVKEYLDVGGIPKYVFEREDAYLNDLYQDVLYRDIVNKYGVKKVESLRQLGTYALSNYSRLLSARKLTQIIGVKNHSTVSEYLSYLEAAYLTFLVPRYAYSLKRQYVSPRKLYVSDLGLARTVGFSFSQDLGHKLENTVYLELRRRLAAGEEIFYFKDEKKECDFVVQKGVEVVAAVQVTAELTDANRKRELGGLLAAMNAFDIPVGYIVTMEQKETITDGPRTIHLVPIYEWLLGEGE